MRMFIGRSLIYQKKCRNKARDTGNDRIVSMDARELPNIIASHGPTREKRHNSREDSTRNAIAWSLCRMSKLVNSLLDI